jgi:erythromycin esterase-like protein
MWRNTAFEGFVEWLKSFNAARKAEIMGGSLRAGISQVRLLLSLGG